MYLIWVLLSHSCDSLLKDPDAGKSASQIQLERAVRGRGTDPFCYNELLGKYVLYADLGYYSFPLSTTLCSLEKLRAEKWLDYQVGGE